MGNPHHFPLWESLNLNPSLLRAALALLPISADPLSDDDLIACWGVGIATVDVWQQELLELGILQEDYEGCVTIIPRHREKLLWVLVEEGKAEEATKIVGHWLQRHAAQREPLLTAWAFELSADLALQQQDIIAVVRALRCSLALRKTHGDIRGEATRSWSLGAFLVRHGRREEGIEHIRRAAELAKDLGLKQAAAYRRRLNQLLAEQDHTG